MYSVEDIQNYLNNSRAYTLQTKAEILARAQSLAVNGLLRNDQLEEVFGGNVGAIAFRSSHPKRRNLH